MVFDFLQFAIFYRLFRCHIEAPSGLGRFRPMAAEQTKRRQRGGSHCNALQIYIEPGFSLFLRNYLDTDFFCNLQNFTGFVSKIMALDFCSLQFFTGYIDVILKGSSGLGKFRPMATFQTKRQQ